MKKKTRRAFIKQLSKVVAHHVTEELRPKNLIKSAIEEKLS